MHSPVGRSDRCVVVCPPSLERGYEAPKVRSVLVWRQGPVQKDALLTACPKSTGNPCTVCIGSCEDQFPLFETIMNNLTNTHLPVKPKPFCASDPPWVTDHFKGFVHRRQFAFSNQTLYKFHRNKVNCASRYLQKAHYNQKINSLSASSGQWWRDILK